MTPLHAALKAQIISLEARLKVASGYQLNTDLMLECNMLRAQIDSLKAALEEELKRVI